MNAIKATIRNGRVEPDQPLSLPEGTEVMVVPSGVSLAEKDWDDSPEGIAAWWKWYESLEPLIFTEEEKEALEADRKARKAWELAHAEERAEKLKGLWE